MEHTRADTATVRRGLEGLAEFLADTTEVLAGVEQHAALVILDTLGVILAGSQEPEVGRLVRRISTLGADGPATVFARGFRRTDAPAAAFLNGTAGTFLELDEGHRPTGHPGIHVVPAALALGEALGRSGRRVLRAVVLGYEVAARLSASCRLRRGIHPHGTLGTVGAAAACGTLLSFDAKMLAELLHASAALALASPMQACLEGATIRNSYAGVGAQLGIQAALMVESGFTGLADGLGETFGRLIGEDFEPTALLDGLGERYEITRNYFKFHACCAYNHPALDAVMAILAERAVDPAAVERIEVRTIAPFAGIDQKHPRTQLAAKFSIPYAVAAALCYGTTGAEAFRPATVQDPRVHDLAERVTVVADPEFTQRWPRETPTEVSIHLRGGTRRSAVCTNPRGYYANPGGREDVEGKFRSLTAEIFPAGRVDEAHAAIRAIGDVPRLSRLTDRLRELGGA